MNLHINFGVTSMPDKHCFLKQIIVTSSFQKILEHKKGPGM